MKFLNVEIPVKNLPELDEGFVPLGLFFKSHQALAKKPVCIAVERSGGYNYYYKNDEKFKVLGAGFTGKRRF